jgi:hypothetical protein
VLSLWSCCLLVSMRMLNQETGPTEAGDPATWVCVCCGRCNSPSSLSPLSPLSSSSISVVSVPLDVTGEGPTMSLGLKALGAAGDALRSIEFG